MQTMTEPPDQSTIPNIAGVVKRVHELVFSLPSDDRERVLRAVGVLLGNDSVLTSKTTQKVGTNSDSQDVKAYFANKDPRNKKEALAVAARWGQVTDGRESMSKDDFKRVITSAGRSFDAHNFSMDIVDAKRSSGFFVNGTGRDEHKISYYGEQYIDALPDRDAASKLKRPTKKRPKGKKDDEEDSN